MIWLQSSNLNIGVKIFLKVRSQPLHKVRRQGAACRQTSPLC
ncbi:hypothetical protein [Nostoc sp.]|nr:hypothetical protein [Nostoc sp.]